MLVVVLVGATVGASCGRLHGPLKQLAVEGTRFYTIPAMQNPTSVFNMAAQPLVFTVQGLYRTAVEEFLCF